MAPSILSNDHVCYICGFNYDLHRHHVFFGTANRRLSDEYGCWCYLCTRHHVFGETAVHSNKTVDLKLKKHTQKLWEQKYGSRDDFIRIFGKSYL